MFDTVGFFIPVTKEQYDELITKGVMTQRIDRESGWVEFEYTNFRVSHSWNYRILWKVDNKHYEIDEKSKIPIEVEGRPYLRLEFSAPKILYGHNLKSVDVELMLESCLIVAASFEKMTGVELPGPGAWHVYRVDTCANYLLENIGEVKGYIKYLQRLNYPRRWANTYKDTGLYFASRHNTLKFYCKGKEFIKHDADRFVDELERKRLQNIADRILRVEVEHKRSLRYLVSQHELKYNEIFKKFKGCVDLDDLLYVVNFKNEMERVMKKFLVGTETRVMRSLDVFRVLSKAKGSRGARSLYAVYMLLVTQGQMEVKNRVSRSVYYRALRVFRDNGISVIVSDVSKDESFVEDKESNFFLDRDYPQDFSLKMVAENKYYQLPLAA